MLLGAWRWWAANTFWNSWATPIAATPDRPVFAWAVRWRRITSIFRSPFLKRTIGMWLSSAKVVTARRNRVPIFSITAGEGIGNPRCWVMKETTCPPTCKEGT